MNINKIPLLIQRIHEITNLEQSNKQLFIDLLNSIKDYIENTKNNKNIDNKNYKRKKINNTKISSVQKFFDFYKDNKNRVININSEKEKLTNVGKFSNIQFTKNGSLIKFGKYVKSNNITKINQIFISEFRAFLFNLYLYRESPILFPEIKEFGVFLDGKIISTYGIYEKYDCDLYQFFFGNRAHLFMFKSKVGKIKFINNLMKQVMTAIKIMHDKNLVHGDIKCENILLKEKIVDGLKDYNFALCDFGFTHSKGTIVYSLQGTFGSISPLTLIEYFSSIKKMKIEITINYADDFYSLAYTFFILITKSFPNKDYKNIEKEIFGKDIKTIALLWLRNYDLFLGEIFEKIDIVKENILNLFPKNNPNLETISILEEFIKGIDLIKSLFASNNYRNLVESTKETQKVINRYLGIETQNI
jgi:serine/threonine protein kinase